MSAALASPKHAPLGYTAFVVLIAGLMGMNPLAIDIMLPAFGLITQHYTLEDPNRVQTVITFYLLGFGIGQLLVGIVADSVGRRAVLLWGVVIYALSGLACAFAPSFELLLAARFLCGLASASPRVVATAMVRDCYDGRMMARVLALVMTFFMAMPLIAPLVGQVLIMVAPWWSVFLFVAIYGVALGWFCWRNVPETHPVDQRRPVRLDVLSEGLSSVLGSRQTMGYAVAAGVFLGALFGFVGSAQQIMTEIFNLGALFPVVFAIIAVTVSLSSFVNSRTVERYGMRRISHLGIVGFLLGSILLTALEVAGLVTLWVFLPLFAALMLVIGLVFSNFSALALEPQGHVAGLASSVTGACGVLLGAGIGYLVGQAYDGTILPMALGFTICGAGVLGLLMWIERGHLFGRSTA